MATVVLTVHLIIALALIVVVLLQRSEGGGLGMGGGGGGGVMTGRGAATALSKVTWMLGIAFVVTSLALTIIGVRDGASNSVIDGLAPSVDASGDGSPASSPLGNDLLPPLPEDGPSTPPAADEPATPPAVE
ncbi:preprotein translocase subunit SecG [Amaricoccus tamworthensis]|uniref:preprotein translocase subunit SecG n=1 Tax=Amaricoccus tamworthensis TaxID=57002 RepID=UPI003C79F33A